MASATRSSMVKMILALVMVVVMFFAVMIAKWYDTTVREPIHPQRGVYGMDDLEIWIGLNTRMPAFAREWACKTLREREKAALNGRNSLPPHSCEPGFGEMEEVAPYQAAADANLARAAQGLDAAQVTALNACFEAKMAASVTPDEVQRMNDDDQAVMSKVVIAINQNARACRAEVAS